MTRDFTLRLATRPGYDKNTNYDEITDELEEWVYKATQGAATLSQREGRVYVTFTEGEPYSVEQAIDALRVAGIAQTTTTPVYESPEGEDEHGTERQRSALDDQGTDH